MKTTLFALQFNTRAPRPYVGKFFASVIGLDCSEREGEVNLDWFFVDACDTPTEYRVHHWGTREDAESYLTRHNCKNILNVVKLEVNWDTN